LDQKDKAGDDNCDGEKSTKSSVESEQEEVFCVPRSHTAVNPGAVMVHFENTYLALRTMMSSNWLPRNISLLTPSYLLLGEIAGWHNILGDNPGVAKRSPEVGNGRHVSQPVEN
jgi:hypothetical protein